MIIDYVVNLMPELPQGNYVSEAVVNDLLAAMGKYGKKIEAIKAYRALTHAGLREAKEAVEKYWIDDPASHPKDTLNTNRVPSC